MTECMCKLGRRTAIKTGWKVWLVQCNRHTGMRARGRHGINETVTWSPKP